MASIQKRPDGRYRARYRDDAGREHARHFARQTDAKRWLGTITVAVGTDSYVDPKAGSITFLEFYRQWAARQVWAPNTVTAMTNVAAAVPFAVTPMSDIRRSHIEAWVKSMAVANLAPNTITTRFKYVRSTFLAARRDKVIGVNPTEGVTLPRRRRSEAAMRIPSPEVVGKIITAAEPGFATLFGLCAFAGLRLGEAAAVQLQDIDFLRRTLAVTRQVQRAGAGKLDIRLPKYGSERTVYLPDELVVMLSEHVRAEGVAPAGWLFAGPPDQDVVHRAWLRAARTAGAGEVKLHDLRHFYASGLIAAGCDVVTVQRALGHGSASITLGTYSHLWPTAEDRTRVAAGAVMRTAFADSADSLRTFAPK